MKVERYARISIPIMKDVYEVLELAIAEFFPGFQRARCYRLGVVPTGIAIGFVGTLGLHLVWPFDAFIILHPALRILPVLGAYSDNGDARLRTIGEDMAGVSQLSGIASCLREYGWRCAVTATTCSGGDFLLHEFNAFRSLLFLAQNARDGSSFSNQCISPALPHASHCMRSTREIGLLLFLAQLHPSRTTVILFLSIIERDGISRGAMYPFRLIHQHSPHSSLTHPCCKSLHCSSRYSRIIKIRESRALGNQDPLP